MSADKIIDRYNEALPELKGGEQKAFWVILVMTLGRGKVNCVISNEDFICYGAHLTKSRDVIVATNSLVDKGLIFKVKDEEEESNRFRYMVKFK